MEDKICISINNKKFNKENEKTKEAIYKALNKLCELILQFEENGQPFEREKDKIIIALHQYAVKRRNNKSYIEAFEKYVKNYNK